MCDVLANSVCIACIALPPLDYPHSTVNAISAHSPFIQPVQECCICYYSGSWCLDCDCVDVSRFVLFAWA